MLRRFGISRSQSRDHVAAWEEGKFLASDAGEYAYFAVDTYDAVQPFARGPSLAVVAWKYWADDAFERLRLSGRIAQFA